MFFSILNQLIPFSFIIFSSTKNPKYFFRTEERFWKIFITIFRQQLSLMNFWDSSSQSQTALGHTYNEEEKDEIWRERIYTIVQQLAIAKTSDKTAETKEEDKQSTRTKPENKGVQQSIPRKKPTRVISVYCTLCKSKFGSQEEYQAHLDKCTRNISTLQIALTPVVPHKKISELNHNEWRTVFSHFCLFLTQLNY